MTKIKPFVVPNAKVAPLPKGDESFRLTEKELPIFDTWAQESNGIWGTTGDFYSLDLNRSTRDPLYDEPTTRVWRAPFSIKMWVSAPSQTPVVGEEGFRIHFDASGWIARIELEKVAAPDPREGDVLRFWSIPFFDVAAAARDNIPKAGYYFDVLQVNPDGHLFDTPSFVGFRLTLKRRSEFGAERKISP